MAIPCQAKIIFKSFQSIAEAARYCSEHFGCSESGMMRNYKSKGYEIVLEGVTTKCED